MAHRDIPKLQSRVVEQDAELARLRSLAQGRARDLQQSLDREAELKAQLTSAQRECRALRAALLEAQRLAAHLQAASDIASRIVQAPAAAAPMALGAD